MDNTVSGCKFALALDERINVEEQPLYVGYKGASSLVLRKQQITGSIGANNLHFDITPPARCIVDKRVFLDLEATFNFTVLKADGTAENGQIFGAPLEIGAEKYIDNGTDALRWLPFQQCCNSVNLNINGVSITENTNSYVEALGRAGWQEDWVNHDGSMTPLMHDTAHNYAANTAGFAPLNGYKVQNTRYMPRGHIPMRIVVDAANTNTAQVVVKWSEPVLLPLLGHTHDEKGFIDVNQMNFEFNYQDLYRMWSTGNTALTADDRRSTISATITNARIRMTYLIPPENLALPEINKYPYYGMTRYTSSSETMPTVGQDGAPVEFSLQNINLGGIPSRIFFWVQPTPSVKRRLGTVENAGQEKRQWTSLAAWGTPDSYAAIDRINLDFNGRSAVLTDANQYDLYRMAVKDSKLDMTFPQWQFYVGSIMALNPWSLPLDSLQCSGSRGNVDFQLRVWARNHSVKLNGDEFQLFCVIVDEGVYTMVAGGESYLEINKVSPANVLEGKYITYANRISPDDLQGGVFGFLKKAAHGVGRAIEWASKNAPKAIQAVKHGVQLAEKYAPQAMGVAAKVAPLLLGLGYSEDEVQAIMDKKTGAGPWVGGSSEAGFSGMSASGLKAAGGRASKRSYKK